jgi:hypothetical protein
MRKLQGYTDEGSPGRDWNVATGMVIEGKAGFQKKLPKLIYGSKTKLGLKV